MCEFLRDDVVHFEVSGKRDQPPEAVMANGLFVSPMVSKTDYPVLCVIQCDSITTHHIFMGCFCISQGPSMFIEKTGPNGLRLFITNDIRVEVDPNTLEAVVFDTTKNPEQFV